MNEQNLLPGYRALSPQERDLVVRIKALGNEQLAALQNEAVELGADPRMVAIAKTQLQMGFMALIRAVTRPTEDY